MPELPEAEAARRHIADGVLHRTIEGFSLGEVRHVTVPSLTERDRFIGTQFTRTHRHGKYIFVGSKTGPWLHFHLGMAGFLCVTQSGMDLPDYIRLTITFEGGTQLHFCDPRKFGAVQLVEDVDDFIAEKRLGPDALTIGDNAFAATIGTSRGAVKSALMSQKKLAGVGNLWSDEALYQTGIDPEAQASRLPDAKINALHGALHNVLQSVVNTNAVYGKLPDDWLIHHRKDGADCTRCAGTITKKIVGGRTSFHCPDHQVGP